MYLAARFAADVANPDPDPKHRVGRQDMLLAPEYLDVHAMRIPWNIRCMLTLARTRPGSKLQPVDDFSP